jgi:RNA polymerase sigma factor (sigma-70 family)
LNDIDPDLELLSGVSRGEPAAVREMVARKLPRLTALATRVLGDRAEANDVAQETFMQIWKHAGRWQPGSARFDTWIHRVALNLCNDRLRRRRDFVTMDDAPEPMDPTPAPDEQMESAGRSERIEDAVAALPARQRQALVLHYYQELSNIEAADVMNISVEALESLLSRARRQLRIQLADDRDPPLSGKDRR